jgi:GcrA cell cycle regulator
VERDPAQPLSQIHAVPLATIESDREVLFVWGRPGHPAAPASAAELAVGTPVEPPKPVAKPTPTPAAKPKPAAPKPADRDAQTPVEPPDSPPPTEIPAPTASTPEAPAT